MPRSEKEWKILKRKNWIKNRIRWFPGRTKKRIRVLLRKLGLMKPYVPKDAYNRPFPLEHVLSCTGKGWENLLRECYTICINTETDIHQVKEKFGGLRFYVGGSSSKALDDIESICSRSYEICENCGELGEPRKGSWIKTLCDSCTKVEFHATSHELEHLLSNEANKQWQKDIRTGKVARTFKRVLDALEKEN